MKRILIKILLFLLLTSRAISAEVNLLEGITWDSDSNTYAGYYDANKLSTAADDDLMCWAFAASNQIAYWQDSLGDDYQAYMAENNIPTGEGETYEYAVTDAFVEDWDNIGGYQIYGLMWWMSDLDGYYYTSYTQSYYTSIETCYDDNGNSYEVYYYNNTELFSTKDGEYTVIESTSNTVVYSNDVDFPTELGGYWDDFVVDMDSVAAYIDLEYFDADLFISEMDAAIESNYTMTLMIYSDTSGHALTLWGYALDDEGNYSIFVTDSDDGLFALIEYGIYYDKDDKLWYFYDYYIALFTEDDTTGTVYNFDGWYLGGLTVFNGFGSIAVPEPSTYATILGLFALGFACYRKSKK